MRVIRVRNPRSTRHVTFPELIFVCPMRGGRGCRRNEHRTNKARCADCVPGQPGETAEAAVRRVHEMMKES